MSLSEPRSLNRVHVPELEQHASNQRPKTRDHREPKLYRYEDSDIYQWFSKRGFSVFEDPFGEPFAIDATRAEGVAALQQAGDGWVLVPRDPTEEQLFAARGLLMSLSMGAPNYQVSLGDVAASGYYGEAWGHILTDEERAIARPLSKGHRAQLIYRAMLSAAPLPQQTALVEQGVEE